jgi:CBS domain containing-hemolysin-like protein
MRELRVARLAVTRDGGVIGVVRATRLLAADPAEPIENHVEPPVHLQGIESLDRILAAMQESPAQTGVLPVAGAGTGIVLMDDLVDALVGRHIPTAVLGSARAPASGAAGAAANAAARRGQESA